MTHDFEPASTRLNEPEEKKTGQNLNRNDSFNLASLASDKSARNAVLCHEKNEAKLLSMLGPILSFEQHTSGSCSEEAHPYGQSEWTAVDMRKLYADDRIGSNRDFGRAARLTDYFPAKDIHAALIKDSVIGKALRSIDLEPESVKSLDELMKHVERGLVYIDPNQDRSGKSYPLCFSMNKDMLTSFAFNHVEGDKIAVRIGLPGNGLCRENLTQIGILLPIPRMLKNAAEDARIGKGGFLMEKAPKAAKTSFSRSFVEKY